MAVVHPHLQAAAAVVVVVVAALHSLNLNLLGLLNSLRSLLSLLPPAVEVEVCQVGIPVVGGPLAAREVPQGVRPDLDLGLGEVGLSLRLERSWVESVD